MVRQRYTFHNSSLPYHLAVRRSGQECAECVMSPVYLFETIDIHIIGRKDYTIAGQPIVGKRNICPELFLPFPACHVSYTYRFLHNSMPVDKPYRDDLLPSEIQRRRTPWIIVRHNPLPILGRLHEDIRPDFFKIRLTLYLLHIEDKLKSLGFSSSRMAYIYHCHPFE